jgi:3,4-dihydroxyphenylacetate 2,3-dioxygenase
MSGVIAAGIVAHVPTLARPEITPDFQRTLVDGERALGAKLRALSPDLWVVISTHWVSTFNWFATCQAQHQGICVADEAPDLIPGMPYSYPGHAGFGRALVEAWQAAGLPAARNESPHYAWDYGTFVPLSHLDPQAQVAVVGVPVVLMADLDECARAGAAIHATAKALGLRAVVLASSALSHALVRGRQHEPLPERREADARTIERLQAGDVAGVQRDLPRYARDAVVEMGGRAIATLLGAARALAADGKALRGRQFGGYAQSSGSGNANLVLAPEPAFSALD